MVDFQPPDLPEPDHDALWDAWFDKQEKNGCAVLTRSEWHERLDEAARDGYAEGRSDQAEEDSPLVEALELIASLYDYEASCGDLASRLYEARCIARAALSKATGEPQ
jgi:hypothetical protein